MKRFVTEFAKHREGEIMQEYSMTSAMLFIDKPDGYEEKVAALKAERDERIENVRCRVEQCKYGYLSETAAVRLIEQA